MEDVLRDRAAAWYYREHFGFAKAPPHLDLRAMAIALVTVANGDRQITTEERNWLVGYFAAKGYSQDVVREAMGVAAVDPAAISALLESSSLRKSARILIYDAIRVAAVDGYGPGEAKALRSVASTLGLDEAAVAEIEALVKEEQALREKRIAVLMPDGHPFLDLRHPR